MKLLFLDSYIKSGLLGMPWNRHKFLMNLTGDSGSQFALGCNAANFRQKSAFAGRGPGPAIGRAGREAGEVHTLTPPASVAFPERCVRRSLGDSVSLPPSMHTSALGGECRSGSKPDPPGRGVPTT